MAPHFCKVNLHGCLFRKSDCGPKIQSIATPGLQRIAAGTRIHASTKRKLIMNNAHQHAVNDTVDLARRTALFSSAGAVGGGPAKVQKYL